MIHVDPNHTNSDQPIPADSTNIESIHDSADIHAIENILKLLVKLVHTPTPVPASPIFLYGRASDPLSQLHDSAVEILTPKVNSLPLNNPPNPVLNLQSGPDSDIGSSDSYLLDLYESSDDDYCKKIRRAKKNKNKRRSKTCLVESIKNCAKLTSKLLTHT